MSEAVKRLRKNTTRPKSCCRPPVHHISPVSDHWLWRLTHSPLFTVTDHWPMIWLAVMGNRCVCDWRRQWTPTSLRWGNSALHSSCISEQHLLIKKKKIDIWRWKKLEGWFHGCCFAHFGLLHIIHQHDFFKAYCLAFTWCNLFQSNLKFCNLWLSFYFFIAKWCHPHLILRLQAGIVLNSQRWCVQGQSEIGNLRSGCWTFYCKKEQYSSQYLFHNTHDCEFALWIRLSNTLTNAMLFLLARQISVLGCLIVLDVAPRGVLKTVPGAKCITTCNNTFWHSGKQRGEIKLLLGCRYFS